jgi:Cu-Zn family superoxide dismutase
MRTPSLSLSLPILALLSGLAGCAAGPAADALARLEPTRGNAAAGEVRFKRQGDAVIVEGRISGLKPGQEHGFHIHEKGDCSSGDGMSAGGHFNPTAKPHGPLHGEHHVGDLPALKAGADGVASFSVRVDGMSIGSGATDIVGRALIVHAQPDDYSTQPTGNSGARIACAVIRRAA